MSLVKFIEQSGDQLSFPYNDQYQCHIIDGWVDDLAVLYDSAYYLIRVLL